MRFLESYNDSTSVTKKVVLFRNRITIQRNLTKRSIPTELVFKIISMLQTFNFYEINFGKEDITANSYTQLFVHLIFVVEGRQSLITNSFKEKLNKYITGIIQQKKNKLIAINGMPDHLHILIGLNPDVSISALVQETKRCSTNYINENRFVIGRFSWQKGMLLFLIQNHLLVR